MNESISEVETTSHRILRFIKAIQEDDEPDDVIELFKLEVRAHDADVVSLNAILDIARSKSPHYETRRRRDQASLQGMMEQHCDS